MLQGGRDRSVPLMGLKVSSPRVEGVCPAACSGMKVVDLRGHCLQVHVPEVFRDLGTTGPEVARGRYFCLMALCQAAGGQGPEGPQFVLEVIQSLELEVGMESWLSPSRP